MNDQIVPFNYLSGRDSFSRVREHTGNLFRSQSHKVHTESWQGVDIGNRPEMVSHELMNYTFTQDLKGNESLQHWQDDVKPNLPWADDHFMERVCGYPINPGVEWQNWPWGESASKFLDLNGGRFNHNYMERYWPKYAGHLVNPTGDAEDYGAMTDEPCRHQSWTPRGGIRNPYGDLDDLVNSLAKQPLSRQEWFPIFHPEDVGVVVGGRKPCSLGYQFWVRGGRLHVYYPLRSCDFIRHMQDDIYLTLRLLLWVLEECRTLYRRDQIQGGTRVIPNWDEVTPGTFTMHCTSLHVFANDMAQMKRGD